MKYKYWFKEMNFVNSDNLLIIRLEPELLPVQIFLCSDVQGSKKTRVFALEYIDKVLSEESEYESFAGNACYVEVRKEMTKVEYMFTNNDTEESCEIETTELRELIEIWLTEKESYYKK